MFPHLLCTWVVLGGTQNMWIYCISSSHFDPNMGKLPFPDFRFWRLLAQIIIFLGVLKTGMNNCALFVEFCLTELFRMTEIDYSWNHIIS